MKRLLFSFTLVLAGLAGCAEDDHDDAEHGEAEHGEAEHGEEGTPSGAACDSTLTYDNFGQSFMDSYCTRCHSSTLSGAARNGAPDGHDFDSLAGILAVGDHVDEWAASGPDATNEQMPPSDPRPSMAEREMLGAWLACELAP